MTDTVREIPPRGTDYHERVTGVLSDLPDDASAPAVWAALGSAGLVRDLYRRGHVSGCAPAPERLAALLHAVDARGDNGVTLSVLVQAASAVPLLASAATDEPPLHEALEQALSGRALLALAATDRGAAGSDLSALRTEVTLGEEELVLDGGKRWIATACRADWLLVLARHRPGRHFTSFAWVLVPARAPGVTIRPADSDLLTGAATGDIEFDGVRLPVAHLVGSPGRGMAVFARHMATERLAGALWATALVGRVLADTKNRLCYQYVDDQPLWHNPAVRQRFAAGLVQVRQLKELCESLGRRIVDQRDLTAAAVLKAAAGLVVDPVLASCAQMQGAEGFARGGIQRIRAEAAVMGIGGGVTELLLDTVADNADALLKELRS